jgi:hypothetical protein
MIDQADHIYLGAGRQLWKCQPLKNHHWKLIMYEPRSSAHMTCSQQGLQPIMNLETSYHIITQRRNSVGFLPEVWSPIQATVHLCGTRDHGF